MKHQGFWKVSNIRCASGLVQVMEQKEEGRGPAMDLGATEPGTGEVRKGEGGVRKQELHSSQARKETESSRREEALV